jgi:hypothetical protein
VFALPVQEPRGDGIYCCPWQVFVAVSVTATHCLGSFARAVTPNIPCHGSYAGKFTSFPTKSAATHVPALYAIVFFRLYMISYELFGCAGYYHRVVLAVRMRWGCLLAQGLSVLSSKLVKGVVQTLHSAGVFGQGCMVCMCTLTLMGLALSQ